MARAIEEKKREEKGDQKRHFSFAFIARAKDEGPRRATVVSYRKKFDLAVQAAEL